MHEHDEEALMAVAGLFRMLYDEHKRTSFTYVMKLLTQHVDADDPALKREAIKQLREHRRGRAEILRMSTIRMIVEHRRADGSVRQETLTTEQIIDLWLHGEL